MIQIQQTQRLALWGVALLVGIYAVFLFPYAYFRHDDWLMLGNSVLRVPQNWALLFHTSWIEKGVERIWFFRPLFKLSYYLGFQAFGFSYYAWLATTLVLTLISLAIGYCTLVLLTGSKAIASFFILLFASNVHFHLGSLLWAGEGYMNVPSVFLLAISTYSFVVSLKNKNNIAQIISVATFFFALGFKEASFAHIIFLAGIYYFYIGKFEWIPRPLIPHIVLTVVYLIFRLFILPLNPGYHPELKYLLESSQKFGVSFLVPFVILRFFYGKQWTTFAHYKSVSGLIFALFLVITLLPHQGHPFFSPGWLFYPGFFMSFAIALSVRDISQFKLKVWACVALFLGTGGGIFYVMYKVNWWQWGAAQKEMHAILDHIPADKNTVVRVRDCNSDDQSAYRVIGYPGGISDWYETLKGIPLNIEYSYCQTPTESLPHALWYDFKFPHFIKAP